MDLSTKYLGIDLPHPLMPGASPLVDDLDRVKRLQDAGASAIVMHSLFEEQLAAQQVDTMHHIETHAESFAEAMSYLPVPTDFNLGPDEYLEQTRKIKEMTGLPVIGSLNGTTVSGWLDHAKLIQEAGADALELNVYYVATDPTESGRDIELRLVEITRAVCEAVNIPVAVKLSPYYSSLAHLAHSLEDAGAQGLVLFNRFYQPDFNVEELKVERSLELSTSSDLPLRVQWLAVLSAQTHLGLAASGGVHSPLDVIKSVMAGAHAVQVVSSLLMIGPEHLKTLREGVEQWLVEHEYESLDEARGSLNLARCPDAAAFERSNYVKILQSWRLAT